MDGETKRAYARKHYAENAEHYREYKREYYKNNKDKWKKSSVQAQEMRKEIFDLLGGRCARCGFDDERALQVDHVNGDGHLDRDGKKPRSNWWKRNKEIIRSIKTGEGRYQILCANCNWIKRAEMGEDGGGSR